MTLQLLIPGGFQKNLLSLTTGLFMYLSMSVNFSFVKWQLLSNPILGKENTM